MLVSARRTAGFLPICLAAVVGCGGLSKTDDNPNAQVTLSLSKNPAAPGEAVTLSWSSRKATTVVSSNFGANTLSGTVTVSSLIPVTYAMTVHGTGPDATGSVTANITSGGETYVLVGTTTDAEVPQIQSLLQQLGTTVVQTTVPTSAAGVSAVIVHTSGSIGTADAPRVKALLDQGVGVVLLGTAPRLLATGSASNTDTTAIASWFGGATKVSTGVESQIRVINTRQSVGILPIPLPMLNMKVSEGGVYGPEAIGAAAERDIQAFMLPFGPADIIAGFSYRPPSGGRLYYQYHAYGTNTTNQAATVQCFQLGARWAALGGT